MAWGDFETTEQVWKRRDRERVGVGQRAQYREERYAFFFSGVVAAASAPVVVVGAIKFIQWGWLGAVLVACAIVYLAVEVASTFVGDGGRVATFVLIAGAASMLVAIGAIATFAFLSLPSDETDHRLTREEFENCMDVALERPPAISVEACRP